MKKKRQLKKESQTTEKTIKRLPVSEMETLFQSEDDTDLQKYTFTFSLKKRKK